MPQNLPNDYVIMPGNDRVTIYVILAMHFRVVPTNLNNVTRTRVYLVPANDRNIHLPSPNSVIINLHGPQKGIGMSQSMLETCVRRQNHSNINISE